MLSVFYGFPGSSEVLRDAAGVFILISAFYSFPGSSEVLKDAAGLFYFDFGFFEFTVFLAPQKSLRALQDFLF